MSAYPLAPRKNWMGKVLLFRKTCFLGCVLLLLEFTANNDSRLQLLNVEIITDIWSTQIGIVTY